ncbi:MAG: CotH kinase family protein [Vicinamibacterales bacterium]
MLRQAFGAAMLLLLLAGSAAGQTADDFFSSEVLQRVDLWMNAKDWDKLKANFKENDYYPADLTWNGITAYNIGIRSRGLGSRSSTKPGLRVDMDRYATDQKFIGIKSFVLDNLVQDPSGIRETTAMRLFARLGIAAPRETHTRLYVNGNYIGLYALVESVDKDMLARVYGSINDDVQNDGYLFEYNYVLDSPWKFEYLGSSYDGYKARFSIKTNESKSDSHIWGPIEELVRLVNQTASPGFEASINPKLDLAGFVKYLAAQSFVAENDGFVGYAGMNNFYLYRLENKDQHVFIAWDEDNSFFSTDFPINARLDENVLARTTLELPAYRTQFYTSVNDAASSANDGDWLHAEIERQLNMIADAMNADTAKPYSNADHAAARNTMLAFPAARITFVQCEVAKQLGTAKPAGCP